MKLTTVKIAGAALCFGISMAMPVISFAENLPEKSASATTNWLSSQINNHPDIIAAKENMNAVFSKAEGSKLPLYNPELETGYERDGDYNNFDVGISQTIDWWDKREARTQQANFSLTQASKRFNFVVQEKTAQALKAIITWHAAKKQADIARLQEEQLGTLLDLVTQRQQAGDLGQVDAELTYLSLSQMLNNTAQAQVRLKQSVAQLNELLPQWNADRKVLPQQGFTITNTQPSKELQQEWLMSHPLVLEAKANWQVMKGEAQLALLDTKAEPTFGIKAGQSDKDLLVGVSFSIPLNIRNDFSAEARAVNQQAIAAEAEFRSVVLKQRFAIKASRDTLNTFSQSYARWQKLMQGRGKRIEDLLTKQWQSGDMSTTEYLLALQQRAEGLNAGIELQSQFKLSQIDWLLEIGQINTAVKQLAQ